MVFHGFTLAFHLFTGLLWMVLLLLVLSSCIMETEYYGETTTFSGKKEIKLIASLNQLTFSLHGISKNMNGACRLQRKVSHPMFDLNSLPFGFCISFRPVLYSDISLTRSLCSVFPGIPALAIPQTFLCQTGTLAEVFCVGLYVWDPLWLVWITLKIRTFKWQSET